MDLEGKTGLTVILPAYNEEESIGKVIDEIRALPVQLDILVVDNNSTDDTYNVAIYKGEKVVTEPIKGKGNAMKRGFKLVNSPYIVMMNSDYTYPAKGILDIKGMLDSGFDIVVGCRYWREYGSMSILNSFGNKVLSMLASVLYKNGIRDICTGLWGFKKDILDKLNITSGGFTLEAELFTEAVKHGCKLAQIPTRYRSRLDGSKAKLKVSDGFKIGWFLIKRRFK